MITRRFALVSALATSSFGLAAAGQPLQRTVLAIENGVVPGSADTFDSELGIPAINADGTAVFEGTVDNATSTSIDDYLIFVGRKPGDLRRLVQGGQQIPLPDGRYRTIDLNPAISSSGWVGFSATLYDTIAGSTDDSGRFRVRASGADPVQLAGEGASLPLGGRLGSFSVSGNQPPAINGSGQSVFVSWLSGVTHPTFSQVYAVCRADAAGLTEIARTGDIAPGLNRPFDDFFNPAFNDAGQVAFAARTGLTSGWADSIYRGGDGPLEAVAVRGGPVPGGGVFGEFNSPVINASGQLAFFAYRQGVSSGDGEIFRGTPGALTAIARLGDPMPGGGVFSGADRNIDMNSSGQVCFRAQLSTTNASEGLYVGDGATKRIVARHRQPLAAGGFIYTIYSGAINDAGQVLFYAAITITDDVTPNDAQGIFLHDPTRGLIELARTGEPFMGSTISDLAIAAASPSLTIAPERRGLGGPFRVAFRFDLADGRRGVAVISPACPADFNNSGVVTVQDIFDFLTAYFLGLPTADFNGVGGVTVQDVFDFLVAYFGAC